MSNVLKTKKKMKIKAKYFTEKEFNKCSPSCSLQDMKQNFINLLDLAREIADIPFVLNSAYRSSAYDKSKGRSGTGAHTKGVAVDIRCNSDKNRYLIIDALRAVGFTRIGIGKTYIHVDADETKTQNVIWHYYE